MEKSRRNTLLALALVTTIGCAILWLVASQFGSFSFTPPIRRPFFDADTSSYPTLLSVSGNRLVNRDGQVVTFRGVMPSDPAVLTRKGKFERVFFDGMADSGANVIRIPVHPEQWELDPDYLWRYLDPVVRWNGENGVYTIIELHFIGNIESDSGTEMPDIRKHSKDFSLEFWRQVATYFKETPHVIFEIFNEPAGISPTEWRTNAQNLVGAIRATGARQLIIVGGIEYSRDLSWAMDMPIEDNNTAYAAHIYPAHSSYSWDRWFGNVSQIHPVVMTEWGWMKADPDGDQPYLVGDRITYAEPLMAYLNQRGIGWVACWYDDEWKPSMFEAGFEQLTSFGTYAIELLGSPR